MIALMLGLVEEGRQQRQVDVQFSKEALGIYFTVFMDVFTHGEFQRQYSRYANVVDELGVLMIYGLKGNRE